MDLSLKEFFLELNSKVQSKDYLQCLNLVHHLNVHLKSEEVDEKYLDELIFFTFHHSYGLLNLIETSNNIYDLDFQRVSSKSMQILRTLISDFSYKIHHGDVQKLFNCLKIVTGRYCLDVTRMRALDLLRFCFVHIESFPLLKEQVEYFKNFFEYLIDSLKSRNSNQVKQQQLKTIGCFIKKYHSLIEENQIKNVYNLFWSLLYKLDTHMWLEQRFLHAWFIGFCDVYDTFPCDLQNDSNKTNFHKVYYWLKWLSEPDIPDLIGSRTGLTFFGDHLEIFEKELFKEYEWWHRTLLCWVEDDNSQNSIVGVSTLHKIFQHFAVTLLNKSEDERPQIINLLQYFNTWSRNKLECDTSTIFERRLAVYSLGCLSEASYMHLPSTEVTDLFFFLMENFEKSFILNENYDKNDTFYPDFVQTISNFTKFDMISTSQLNCLQKAVIDLIKSFHITLHAYHGVVISAVVMSFHNLKKTSYYDDFVAEVVYQGVIWSCCHQHSSLEDLTETDLDKLVTVKNFFPLWKGILTITTNTNYDKQNFDFENRQDVVAKVAKEMINTLMLLINKLNVNVKFNEQDGDCFKETYKVQEINDYAIFLNVVDFYGEMFEIVPLKMFSKCIWKLVAHFIMKCIEYPLVSGFYKLLYHSLKVVNKLDLFKDEDNAVDVVYYKKSLSSFLPMLLNQITQYIDDDLLISCLYVLMETSIPLVKEILPFCVTPFLNIFEIGKNYLELADVGLTTLQHWQNNIEPEIFDPILKQILPCLDVYLRTKPLGGDAYVAAEKRRKTMQTLQKRKIFVEREAELVKIQRKILLFIGRQDFNHYRSYVFANEGIKSNLAVHNPQLRVDIPYNDFKVQIYLDVFLQRIIDLALNCSDRKTRVTSCELLQAAVIIFLGQTKPMAHGDLSKTSSTFRSLVMPLLQLSCDVVLVIQQIFQPLVYQLIHWYTSPMQNKTEHSAILLETIMDGITHPTNVPLRDFSSKCINEYVKWSIKHASEQNLSVNPTNINGVVRMIKYFSLHCDESKKLGAALIFNNIYREIREENDLIDIYWLEILHAFVKSLSSLNFEIKQSYNEFQTKLAVVNLQRVFTKKSFIFRNKSEKRKVPLEMNDGTLLDVVLWLFKYTGSCNKSCREVTMDLFVNLAPLSSEKNLNLQHFVGEHLKNEDLFKTYNEISSQIPQTENVTIYSKFIEKLTSTIDGYVFIIKNNLLGNVNFDRDVNLYQIEFFLEQIINCYFAEKFIDMEIYNSLKSDCCYSILKLCNVVVQNVKTSRQFWSLNLWKMILNAVFHPDQLKIRDDSLQKFYEILKVLLSSLPGKVNLDDFTILLKKFYNEHESFTTLSRTVSRAKRSFVKGLMLLDDIEFDYGFKEKLNEKSAILIEDLMKYFYQHGEKNENVLYLPNIHETKQAYFGDFFKIALKRPDGFNCFIKHLYENKTVKTFDSSEALNFGLYVLKTFQDTLIEIVLNHFEQFVQTSFAYNKIDVTTQHLIFIMEYLNKNRNLRYHFKTASSTLLNSWFKFEHYFNNNIKIGLTYAKLLLQINQSLTEPIRLWLVKTLEKDDLNETVEVIGLLIQATCESNEILQKNLTILLEKIRVSNVDSSMAEKILLQLPFVKCEIIFKFIFELLLHSKQSNVNENIFMQFSSKCDENLQKSSLEIMHDSCSDKTFHFERRYELSKEAVPGFVKNCKKTVLETFLKSKLNEMLDEISVINLIFLEAIFCDGNFENEAGIVSENLLKKFLVKNSNLSRSYKCHAYNVLINIMCNYELNTPLYDHPFSINFNDEDVLWNGIIDKEIEYNFPLFFDTIPTQRKILLKERRKLQEFGVIEENSMRYIESQVLFNSSLSEDITKFDFTNSMVRKEEKSFENSNFKHEINLEMVDFNTHESMSFVCKLVQHLYEKFPPDDMLDADPLWIEHLRNILLDGTAHKNIKIFIVKLIINMPKVFSTFSRYFVEPFLRFVLDKNAGNTINYFVIDVLMTLSKWSKSHTLLEEESRLASELLRFLVQELDIERRDVFKYILDIVKLFIESWRHQIEAPFDLIKNLLSSTDKREMGIYLTSVFLVNRVAPWPANGQVEFMKILIKNMNSQEKRIYKITSEVVGEMLHFSDDPRFNEAIVKSLQQTMGNCDKFIFCLGGIALHYPQVVTSLHVTKLLEFMGRVPENVKIITLKIINNALEVSPNIINETVDLTFFKWDSFMENADVECQILCLEIIKKIFNNIKTQNYFQNVLKILLRLISHPNDVLRSCLYDLAIRMYYHDVNVETCKEVLINGLRDPVGENRDKVMKFWVENRNLPDGVAERFSYLFNELYNVKNENYFLGFFNYFMLNIDDYDEILFDYQLENCDFEDYKLETDWRRQHSSTVPLFAQTLPTFDISTFNEKIHDFRLRQTQSNRDFSLTQSAKQFTSLDNALKMEFEFKDPNDVEISTEYKPGRFLKDKRKISMKFAHLETKKKVDKERKDVEMVKEKERQIVIYRSYRRGDFPDIQISLEAVLKPLQMLAFRDNETSSLLFQEFFKSVTKKIKDDGFLSRTSTNIQKIFVDSETFDANLFVALFNILLKNKSKMPIDPDLIVKVCRESKLASLGILLLEEYVIDMETVDEPTSSKRGYSKSSKEVDYWAKLTELYKQVEDSDTIQAIFLQKMNCNSTVSDAIQLESDENWSEALKHYQTLIETDLSEERRDFYYESYFNCLANMGQWNEIPVAIDSVADDLWDKNWAQQKLLPLYVEANIKKILFDGDLSVEFVNNLNVWLCDDDKNKHLKNNFCEELCLMALLQKNTPLASLYMENYIKHFLEDWQSINPMFESLRYNKLLKLSNFTECYDFKEYFNSQDLQPDSEYVKRWSDTSSSMLPLTLLMETRVLLRSQFSEFLKQKFTNVNDQTVVKNLKASWVKLCLNFINTTAEKGNYYMAKKYFTKFENLTHWKIRFASVNVDLAKSMVLQAARDKVDNYFKIIDNYAKITDQDPIIATTKLYDILFKLGDIFVKEPELFETYNEEIIVRLQSDVSTPAELKIIALNRLKDKLENFNIDEISGNKEKLKILSDAYVKLAHFVRNHDDDCMKRNFIVFVLRGMKLDSNEARQLFPSILLEEHLGTAYKELFISEAEEIPIWMYLGWIPQLLANVESKKIHAISKIIIKIAELYPQAVMYPYRLSKENYKFDNVEINTEMLSLTEKLDELLLKNDLANKFVTALSYIALPTLILKNYVEKLIKTNNIDAVYEKVMLNIFDQDCSSRNMTNMMGSIYRSVQQKFKPFFQRLNKLKSQNELKTHLINILKELEKVSVKPSKLLKDYCPWLANFSSSKFDYDIEIPGQYDGKKQPLPQHHVKISSFHPTVLVMQSLRQPIKITMLGMNSKEYPFLVKFGEDTRQDQRIEQLFVLMNEIFNNDTKCANNDLTVLTYQVIPLTTTLGLIEWLNDTEPLTNFVEKNLPPKIQKSFKEDITKEYVSLLPKKSNYLDQYGSAALTYNRNKVVPFLSKLINAIPMDILKTSFWSLSVTAENYIALRNNFMKTYATLCIAHWILGIGDRNLGNILISLKSGKALGIDFGCAFGIATQMQPAPELVPIRLTPHIVNLMEPLKEQGKFKACMTYALKALRNNHESLLAIMNVFIEEPSFDWLEHSVQSNDVAGTNLPDWYPKMKVNQAERKLLGASSTEILIEDLRAGNFKNYLQAYVDMVKGEKDGAFRAKFDGKSNLTVEEQIDCLIDHATDYNLLGRMFFGWKSWF